MTQSTKLISRLTTSSLILMIMMFPATRIHAANGDLHIDNNVITEKVDGQTSGAVTQDTANLFLPATEKHLKQTAHQGQRKLKKVQKQLFAKQQQSTQDPDLVKAKKTVFATKVASADNTQAADGNADDHQLLTILKWPLIAVGALLAIVIGILLGRRFSNVTRERVHG